MTLKVALEECVLANTERSKAFVYKRYYGYLMAVSIRYMKNEMDAEDVVNESFVKIFNKIVDFNFEKNEDVMEKTLKAWMARITANTSIDKLRVKKQTYDIDEIYDTELVQHAVVQNNSLDTSDILKLLDQLPDIQRSIFNMFEIEGYSHEEISDILQIPESTSRTYLTRAKAKLRKLYTDQFSVLENNIILK